MSNEISPTEARQLIARIVSATSALKQSPEEELNEATSQLEADLHTATEAVFLALTGTLPTTVQLSMMLHGDDGHG